MCPSCWLSGVESDASDPEWARLSPRLSSCKDDSDDPAVVDPSPKRKPAAKSSTKAKRVAPSSDTQEVEGIHNIIKLAVAKQVRSGLENIDAEVEQPPVAEPTPSFARASSSGAGSRYYTVWKPVDQQGVWYGSYPQVWRAICEAVGGYAYGRVRLRRYDTLELAVQAWNTQGPGPRDGVPPLHNTDL